MAMLRLRPPALAGAGRGAYVTERSKKKKKKRIAQPVHVLRRPVSEKACISIAPSHPKEPDHNEACHHPHLRQPPPPCGSTTPRPPTSTATLTCPHLPRRSTGSRWRRTPLGGSSDSPAPTTRPRRPHPGKIICVGLYYATYIRESARDLPEYPTLFGEVRRRAHRAARRRRLPEYAAAQLDWKAELAFVIGRPAYQVNEADADDYIAGYSVINDYTMRDYQYRTLQWDQGKNFEKTSGFGPWLVTDTRWAAGSRPGSTAR